MPDIADDSSSCCTPRLKRRDTCECIARCVFDALASVSTAMLRFKRGFCVGRSILPRSRFQSLGIACLAAMLSGSASRKSRRSGAGQ